MPQIIYCPLHASAGKLLEAVKMYIGEENGYVCTPQEVEKAMRSAIAKAEGRA